LQHWHWHYSFTQEGFSSTPKASSQKKKSNHEMDAQAHTQVIASTHVWDISEPKQMTNHDGSFDGGSRREVTICFFTDDLSDSEAVEYKKMSNQNRAKPQTAVE
jgi:hypothetical protein